MTQVSVLVRQRRCLTADAGGTAGKIHWVRRSRRPKSNLNQTQPKTNKNPTTIQSLTQLNPKPNTNPN